MTTVAQVKEVTKPLLEQNSDLALVGRLVVVKPVRHILRGIHIDRSLDPSTFTPTWFVAVLFKYGARIGLDWGDRLYNRAHGPWNVANAETPTVMCREIEEHALPLLRSIQSIDDFCALATSKARFPLTYLSSHDALKIIVDAARGDVDVARAIGTNIAAGRTWTKISQITKEICALAAADDRPGLARLLHAWEAESVKRLKLEKFWEPTPFPLELQPPERSHHRNRSGANATTTAVEVKQLTQPLLERNSDLALVGDLIVVKPVHHLLRGIYFERYLDPREFTPGWLVTILFRPGAGLNFSWGGRLYNGERRRWSVANAETPAAVCREIEEHALPVLRSIQSVDDFYAFATSEERFPTRTLTCGYQLKVMVDVARGDLDAARAMCANMRVRRSRAEVKITKELCALVKKGNRPGLARLLHAWEADSVKGLKLEEFWEPTPFPLELQAEGGDAA
jgi:hypothetical protein